MKQLALDHRTLVYFSRHAQQRMLQRHITRQDVMRVLTKGWVVEVEMPLGRAERWRAHGHDLDGRDIEVVIIADGQELEIEVVTVIGD